MRANEYKVHMDFYLKMIPALSSPGWEYKDFEVMALHELSLPDPDIDILGWIGIEEEIKESPYFVWVKSGRRIYPPFSETAPLRLALFESCTKPIIHPTFDELKSEALRVAYELIRNKKAGWIENRKNWLEKIEENKRIDETWED